MRLRSVHASEQFARILIDFVPFHSIASKSKQDANRQTQTAKSKPRCDRSGSRTGLSHYAFSFNAVAVSVYLERVSADDARVVGVRRVPRIFNLPVSSYLESPFSELRKLRAGY